MSLVINSYQTGRPNKVDVATGIEHLPIFSNTPLTSTARGEHQPRRNAPLTHGTATMRLERERFSGDEPRTPRQCADSTDSIVRVAPRGTHADRGTSSSGPEPGARSPYSLFPSITCSGRLSTHATHAGSSTR